MFEGFIGQEDAVARITVAIKSAMARKGCVPHVIMHGPPGLGKTTMAELIAKALDAKFISAMSTGVKTVESVESLLSRIPRDGYDRHGQVIGERVKCIIFLDEVHNMSQPITELMHTVMENFLITLRKRSLKNGIMMPVLCWVPEFTLIGATNYLGQLPKPFLDRFGIRLPFSIYSDEDMLTITLGMAKKHGVRISSEDSSLIATRARGVPRMANRLVSTVRDVMCANGQDVASRKTVDEAMSLEGIDDFGMTPLDRRVLSFLSSMGRPIGLNALAQGVDEDQSTIQETVEPFLVRLGFMMRLPQGRMITNEGLAAIGSTVPGLLPVE